MVTFVHGPLASSLVDSHISQYLIFWKKHKRSPGKLESLPVFLPQLRTHPCSQGTQSRPVTLVFMFHNIQQKGNISAVNGWSSVTNTDATSKTSLWPLAWWKIARSIKGNTKPKTELAVVHESTEMCSNTWQQHLKPYGGEKQIHSHIHNLCQHVHQVANEEEVLGMVWTI